MEDDYVPEDDDDANINPSLLVDPKHVPDTFNPPMSWRAYNKCRLHYLRYERAFAPIFKCQKFVHRVSNEVVHRIIDIITSPTMIQGLI